jgi:hypothetical protein
MKKSKLFLLTLLCICTMKNSMAQVEEDHCSFKCNRAHMQPSQSRVTYVQLPGVNNYDVKYLKVDLNAETASRYLSGSSTTKAQILQPIDTFVLELKNNMSIDSVLVQQQRVSFTQVSDHALIFLPRRYQIGETINIITYYKGTANSLGVFAGTVSSSGLRYVATLSESYQAREWFPCKQVLSDFIDSTEIWITTTSTNKVGANGLLQGIDTLPSGKHRYRWKTTYPMNYYLPSFSVGNYMEYKNFAKPFAISPDSILVQHYLVNNNTYFNSVKTNLDKTPVFIEKLSELYGLYPFAREKYGHAMANIGGGMEHQTMSTMASFGTTLIAHELGHQWWGDQVTCSSWNDIWINEGFATYSEYLLMEKIPTLFTTTNAAAYMQSLHSNIKSVFNGSVYVPETSIFDENRIFSSRLSYNKGAAIVHHLRFEMQSDSLFFRTLKTFLSEYKHRAAGVAEFKAVAERICNRSFTSFFNQWYYGEGYPTHNVTYYNPDAQTLLLLINQSSSFPSSVSLFTGLLELKINSPQGDTIIKVNIQQNNQIVSMRYNRNITGVTIDPNNWIINNNGLVVNGVVVPVKITRFDVSLQNNCTAKIQWNSEDESSLNRYELEMAEPGKAFEKIGSLVPGNQPYEITWPLQKNGEHLFRLKLIDLQNTFKYTDQIPVGVNCIPGWELNISPNPFTDKIRLQWETDRPQTFNLILHNENGQTILKKIIKLGSVNQTDLLTLPKSIASGVYTLTVMDEQGLSKYFRMVKQ